MPRGFRMGVYVAQTSSDTTVVQYTVDDNDIHYEEFSTGYDVLTPTTFTPTKTGWTFHGWRMDKVASSVVLTNKIATGGLIRLYAVFKQSVTVTYYNNDTTASTASEYKYYNNSNILGAEFTLTEATISGWTSRGWTDSAVSGGAVILHPDATSFRITESETLYGVYQKVVTVSYNANGGTGDPMPDSTGIAYKHPVAGDTNASIILSEATYESTDPDKEFIEWHLNDPDGTSYEAGDTYSSTQDAIMYAYYADPTPIIIYQGGWQDVKSYNNNGYSAGTNLQRGCSCNTYNTPQNGNGFSFEIDCTRISSIIMKGSIGGSSSTDGYGSVRFYGTIGGVEKGASNYAATTTYTSSSINLTWDVSNLTGAQTFTSRWNATCRTGDLNWSTSQTITITSIVTDKAS